MGSKDGLEEIKMHPWLKDVDWLSKLQKKVIISLLK